jgi:hypothetical protein
MRTFLIYAALIGSLFAHAAYVFSSDEDSASYRSSYRSHGGSGGSSWGGFSGGHK